MFNQIYHIITTGINTVLEVLQDIVSGIAQLRSIIPQEIQVIVALFVLALLYYYYTLNIKSPAELESIFIDQHGENKLNNLMYNYLTPMTECIVSYIHTIRNIITTFSFVFQIFYTLFCDSITKIEVATVIFATINAMIFITTTYYTVFDTLLDNIKEACITTREPSTEGEARYKLSLMRSALIKSSNYVTLSVTLINSIIAVQAYALANIFEQLNFSLNLLTRLTAIFIMIGSMVGCIYTKLFDIGLDTAEDINKDLSINRNLVTICELIGDMVGDSSVIIFAISSLSWYGLYNKSGISPIDFGSSINPINLILQNVILAITHICTVYIALDFTAPFEYIYGIFNIKQTQRVEIFRILFSYIAQTKIFSLITRNPFSLEQSLLSCFIYAGLIYGYSFDYPFKGDSNPLLQNLSSLVVKGGSSIFVILFYAAISGVANILILNIMDTDLNIFRLLSCFDILGVIWDIRNHSNLRVTEETEDQKQSSQTEDQIGNAVKMTSRLFVLTSIYKSIGEKPSYNVFGLSVFVFNLFFLTYFFYRECDKFITYISIPDITAKKLTLNIQKSSLYCLSSIILTFIFNVFCNMMFGIDLWQSMKGLSTGIYFLAVIVSTMGSLFDQIKKYILISGIKEEDEQAWINVTYLDTAGDYLKDTLSPFLVYTLMMVCIH